MIDINVCYMFDSYTRDRRHCYRSVFEREIADACDFDFQHDSPEAEAYVEIASEFGFNVDSEASEIAYEIILGNTPADICQELMNRVLEYIKNENLVCYKAGICTKERLTFRDEDIFFYEDSGKLFCILRSEDDVEADKRKVKRIAAHLAEIRNDVVTDEEPTMIEKEEYDI